MEMVIKLASFRIGGGPDDDLKKMAKHFKEKDIWKKRLTILKRKG